MSILSAVKKVAKSVKEVKKSEGSSKPKSSRSTGKTEGVKSSRKPIEDRSQVSKEARASGKKEAKRPGFGGFLDTLKEAYQSPEAQKKRAERKETETGHLRNLEENYSLFDNPGGGKTDGTISLKDIEKVAEGDYDADKAREKLREAGVPEDKIQEQIAQAEKTADYLLENDRFRERLDKANAGDQKTDDKIGRGDLDKVLLGVEKEEREARIEELDRKSQEPPSEQHLADAKAAVNRWSKPGALDQELKQKPLSEFSGAELDALAAVNQNNPEAQKSIEEAVLRSVDQAEQLDELPQGDAFAHLLQTHVTGKELEEKDNESPAAKAQERLGGLVREEIEAKLDERLHDRRGDRELDVALERFSGNVEDLALDNPALLDIISEQAESTAQEYSDEFTEVARRDDNLLQKANHAVTGGFRAGVGFVTDGFREIVSVQARLASAPTRLAGKGLNLALDAGGQLAGAGLDAVGAEGAADRVRSVSDTVGDFAESGANFVADQNEGFTNGLGESVAGTVDGLAYLVTDPKGTVEGLGRLARDPSLFLEGYKETADEHGAAGVAGQVAGDIALTVFTGGGGAAAKGSGLAGRFANLASRGGRAGRVLARGGTGAQRFLNVLDDPAAAAGRLGTRSAASGADDLARTAQRAESLLQRAGRVRSELRVGGRQLVRDGLNGLDNLPGVERLKQAASPVTRPLNRLGEALRGPDAGAFSRRSREFRKAHPELIDDIATARANFESLRGASPEKIGRFIDDHIELANRIDEVSSGRLPDGAGDAVASGRAEILRHLRDNLDTLDPAQARRLARGVLADSDPSGPVYLTRLGPEDRVFRAFNSTDTADGGYFGRVQDRRLSPSQQRANNALTDDNLADRGVIVSPEEGSLAVVSRVGPQEAGGKFRHGAPGGGWQLQFLDPSRLTETLAEIGDHLPFPKMPGLPVVVANPSRWGRPAVSAPPVVPPAVFLEPEEEAS